MGQSEDLLDELEKEMQQSEGKCSDRYPHDS